MVKNVAQLVINRNRSGTESLRKGDLLPCVAVITTIMAFILLNLRVDMNLPLVMACQRVTQGMRMTKCRFDGEWEFSVGRV